MQKKTKMTLQGLGVLALGAAAVLLFTTEKGKDIRKQVRSKAEDWGDDLDDWRDEAGDKFTSLKKRFLSEVESISDDVRSRLSDVIEEGQDRGEKLYKAGKKRFS